MNTTRSLKNVKTILGTMEMSRRVDLAESTKMVQAFKAYPKFTELDTAAMYGGGKTEEFLGQMPKNIWQDTSISMATKVNCWGKNNLTSNGVRTQLTDCLKRLSVDKVGILYLHSPDHKTKLEETLKEVDKQFKAGKFLEFGLSNYAAWQVNEIVNICKINGYVKPTVYQGMYSALTRQVEAELFPCLKYHNIRFYAYSPLGGGILTGKYKFEDASGDNIQSQENSRFFGNSPWCKIYRDRYWKMEHFNGIEELKKLLTKHYPGQEITIPEVAYRWIYNHSKLSDNDGVIIGASSLKQLENNLKLVDIGPLNEEIVEFFETWWKNTSHLCPRYDR